MEEIAVAAFELLEGADVLELVEQRLVGGRGLGVLELVVRELRERVGEARRKLVEERALARGPLARCVLALEPVERLALEVEHLLELLAHLGERGAQVDVAVALAHRLAQLLEQVVEPEHADALDLERPGAAASRAPAGRRRCRTGARTSLSNACSAVSRTCCVPSQAV